MELYRIDVPVVATAYVKANSEDEAKAKLVKAIGSMAGLEVADDGSEIEISGTDYSSPTLPEISLSPAMTVYPPEADAVPELVEELLPDDDEEVEAVRRELLGEDEEEDV